MNVRKHAARMLALSAVFALTAGCAAIGSASNYTSTYTAEDHNPELSASMNDFALEFYTALDTHADAESIGPNRMVSPAGLAIALSMLKGGAEGKSAQELGKVLHMNGMTSEALDQAQKVASDLLRGSDPSVRMEIANSLWSQDGIALKRDYVKKMKSNYEARIQALDFTSQQSVKIINEWASDHTHGTIENVIDTPPGPDTVLLLTNAMYFKGEWSKPFEKSLTEERTFTTEDSQTLEVPTMLQSGRYEYVDSEGFQAIRLPYGESENFGMILALPDEGSSVKAFVESDLPNFETWSLAMEQQPGSIELPRFKLEDDLKLNQTLIALGMPSLFDSNRAELKGLLEGQDADARGPSLSKIKQNTFIDVNEKGTEAAAVTTAFAAGSAAPSNEPFELKLNRPFFFAITDRTTGLIVFMGEVGNPLES
ncbi:serpin family protein [Saccharibacillus sacchari]|uniref:Serpin family protein n=1 Tax=Saccharibacillus sacchari TaxID=456493 RepID=A0ACC6PDE3_9BACL